MIQLLSLHPLLSSSSVTLFAPMIILKGRAITPNYDRPISIPDRCVLHGIIRSVKRTVTQSHITALRSPIT